MANLRVARRSGLVLRGGQQRRNTAWVASVDSTALTALGAGLALLDQAFGNIATLRPFTVVRVRGLVFIDSDQTAALEAQLGALGFLIAQDQAIAAGVASLPTPITEEGSDLWFVHQFFASATSLGNGNGNLRGTSVEFDSKAMRKVEEGDQVAVLIENADAATGFSFWLKFRMLIKLH